jgi:hypothetical protein
MLEKHRKQQPCVDLGYRVCMQKDKNKYIGVEMDQTSFFFVEKAARSDFFGFPSDVSLEDSSVLLSLSAVGPQSSPDIVPTRPPSEGLLISVCPTGTEIRPALLAFMNCSMKLPSFAKGSGKGTVGSQLPQELSLLPAAAPLTSLGQLPSAPIGEGCELSGVSMLLAISAIRVVLVLNLLFLHMLHSTDHPPDGMVPPLFGQVIGREGKLGDGGCPQTATTWSGPASHLKSSTVALALFQKFCL